MPIWRKVAKVYLDAYEGIPKAVWWLALICFVHRAGTMVMPFLTLYLTVELDYGVGEAGRVLALYGLGAIAGSMLGGWLADHWGALRTQNATLLGTAILMVGLERARSEIEVIVMVLALSLVAEAFRPANMACISHCAGPRTIARSFALLRLAINLGMGIGPAIGGVLAMRDYSWIFYVNATTCLGALLLMAIVSKALRGGEDRSGEQEETDDGRPPWRDRAFLLLLGITVLFAMSLFQLWTTVPLYLKDEKGLAENGIGMLLGLNALLIALTEMILVRRLEGFSTMKIVAIGCLVTCLGLGLMPLGDSLIFLAFTVVVWTFGEMLVMPFTNTLVASRAGRKHRGKYMGLYTTSYSVAFMGAPLLGTLTYEELGPTVLWFGIGVLGIPLALGCLALEPVLRKERPINL